MANALRLLVLSYHFPPMSTTGSLRMTRFAKYLPAEVTVDVLTVADPPEPAGNRALFDELQGRVTVVRAPLPRIGTQRWVSRVCAHAPFGSLATKGLRTAYTLFRWIPDWQVTWQASAVKTALAHLHKHPADVLLSTSPPHSTHLIAQQLKRRLGLPWVADFRDPWTQNPQRRWPTPWHRARERRLETAVLAEADAIIANTPGNRLRLLEGFAGLSPEKVVVIPNGFDPARAPSLRAALPRTTPSAPSAALPPARASRRRVLVYTGHLYDGGETVLLALAEELRKDPGLAQRLVVRFVGSLDPDIATLAASLQPSGLVELAGFLPADGVPAEIAAADALLYVVPPHGRHWIPSKLYDYFLAEKPIVAVLPRGDAWDWLAQSGLATLIEDRGPQAVAAEFGSALERLSQDALPATPVREFIARFDARQQSAELATLLRRVVADCRR
ncbi:MAG: glycosyltransferase [Planctomycetota bacterium]